MADHGSPSSRHSASSWSSLDKRREDYLEWRKAYLEKNRDYEKPFSSTSTEDLPTALKTGDDLKAKKKALRSKFHEIKKNIELKQAELDINGLGIPANKTLTKLFDDQILYEDRLEDVEINLNIYFIAVQKERARRGSSASGQSVGSSKSGGSGKSSKSGSARSALTAASEEPAENGWWCRCHTLNYTDPDLQYYCWGCGTNVFNSLLERDRWAFDPHPNDPSPWQILLENPTANESD
ncbi:hypothetical protein ACQKWADRAFT_330638 [Trichoderma austrokoningii]